MTQISSRDGYLYADSYEGILKLLMVLAPIVIGWLYKYLNGDFQGFVLALVISIVNQFYSARVSYKDISLNTRRIKVENMLIIIILAVSFISTLYIVAPSINKGVILTPKDFKIPVILFFISLSPSLFETFYTFFGKDLRISKSFKKRSKNKWNGLKINLTCSNKN